MWRIYRLFLKLFKVELFQKFKKTVDILKKACNNNVVDERTTKKQNDRIREQQTTIRGIN